MCGMLRVTKDDKESTVGQFREGGGFTESPSTLRPITTTLPPPMQHDNHCFLHITCNVRLSIPTHDRVAMGGVGVGLMPMVDLEVNYRCVC